MPGAVEIALEVVDGFLAEDWERTRAPFDDRMRELCSVEMLASVRERVREDAVSQVAVNADRQVCGFFIRRANV